MDLFHGCKTVGDVKRRYRDYAMVLHPDTGGEDWAFRELQGQYEKAKAILNALGRKQMIDAYNQFVEDCARKDPRCTKQKIHLSKETKFALENLSLTERHFWRSFNQGVYGYDRITAWDFTDWLNAAKESKKARERGYAEQRAAARAAKKATEPAPTLEQWIDQCGGLEMALTQLEDF